MASNTGAQIDEIFRCFICLGRPTNAQLVPCCSKICCSACIKKWLTEQRQTCPHCRTSLRVSQLVNARFVNEVSAEIDRMQQEARSKQTDSESCSTHDSPLQYFCKTCNVPICSDCVVFEETHKGHTVEKLNVIYEQHAEKVRAEAQTLRKRQRDLMRISSLVDLNVEAVTRSKDERCAELRNAAEQMQMRLDAQLKAKLLSLLTHKSIVEQEIQAVDTTLEELSEQLNRAPKASLVRRSDELIALVSDFQRKPISQFVAPPVAAEFETEVVPPYDHGTFRLRGFGALREAGEIVYSDVIHARGLTWRLKVYPDGNGVAREAYLSVFLEMVKGLSEPSKYEYRIEMMSSLPGHPPVVREFASDFEANECWGYNRFFRIDLLDSEGYIWPDDSIVLKYHVRAPTFAQQCRDQSRFIEQLVAKQAQLDLRVSDLRRRLASAESRIPESAAGAKEATLGPDVSAAASAETADTEDHAAPSALDDTLGYDPSELDTVITASPAGEGGAGEGNEKTEAAVVAAAAAAPVTGRSEGSISSDADATAASHALEPHALDVSTHTPRRGSTDTGASQQSDRVPTDSEPSAPAQRQGGMYRRSPRGVDADDEYEERAIHPDFVALTDSSDSEHDDRWAHEHSGDEQHTNTSRAAAPAPEPSSTRDLQARLSLLWPHASRRPQTAPAPCVNTSLALSSEVAAAAAAAAIVAPDPRSRHREQQHPPARPTQAWDLLLGKR